MSPEITIEVMDLGKCYPIYDKPRDRLLQMLAPGRQVQAGKNVPGTATSGMVACRWRPA